MLVQRSQRVKSILAQITTVVGTVPSGTGGYVVGGDGGGGLIFMPSDLLVGEDMVGIDFAAVLIDFLPVDAGCAGAGFEVETYAGEVGVFLGTPGAFYVFAGVDGGFEMLDYKTVSYRV